MKDFFDRKTFNPDENITDRHTLRILRQVGSSRLNTYLSGGRGRATQSAAMRWALKATNNRLGHFVDLGCGDSADCLVALDEGFNTARGFDLFSPDEQNPMDWVQADVVERIPYPDASVGMAVSQAMLDLIEPVARESFFREVNRVLKPSGVFACHIQWLQTGWGFDLGEERERAEKVWGKIKKEGTGFVATKGDCK